MVISQAVKFPNFWLGLPTFDPSQNTEKGTQILLKTDKLDVSQSIQQYNNKKIGKRQLFKSASLYA